MTPTRIKSLQEERLWSIDWARDTFPDAEFRFFILQKEGNGYLVYDSSTDPNEAFQIRRRLVEELGTTKLFVRAKRIEHRIIEADGDDDAALDFYRDKHAEGVGLEDIPRHLRAGYLAYQRGRRTAR